MLEFEIKDMTCGHCVSAITQAVNAAAPGAELDISLDTQRIRIGGDADAGLIESAIREAGYSPLRVEAP
ncbi:heavy-metal-associated domain-containing protein [Pusillimonas sp. SM2304]|uniref:heavy-metal-associated domain-containing protein n=1 Tax=Pusillimonas sp. SM2304 TaxID=3073241 RepID=UPI00287666D8|nr:heavy-metal-associated domain-containing protein [Pusillimonas sp. SM2304]MDS1141546.1 heavy-metal-associated domain-containing protein [Pusillimonas sp. SM2304]